MMIRMLQEVATVLMGLVALVLFLALGSMR